MKEKKILENNKLIAQFMCYWSSADNNWVFISPKTNQGIIWCDEVIRNSESGLLYDRDWTYLMSVVEKIESLEIENYNIRVCIDSVRCFISVTCPLKGSIKLFYQNIYNDTDNKIIRMYKLIIEFIKWYNLCQKEN